MTHHHSQKSPLFDDNQSKEADETLYLDATNLLATFGHWKTAQTLDQVRSWVAAFKTNLHATRQHQTQPGSDNVVHIRQRMLVDALEQIAASLTIDRARYYIERLIKSVSETRTNAVNDINLNRWKDYEDIVTDSLWLVDRRDGSGVHRADYWGNFIPQIPQQMMQRYTKQGDWVLDPFAGSGTTLIEGQRLGRNTIGIELQATMGARIRQRLAEEPNPYHVVLDVVDGDSTALDYAAVLQRYQQTRVHLVIMHPPYFDIIKFSDDPRDLSNAASLPHFLTMMGNVVDRTARVLERGRYLVVVIGDMYVRGDWIPLGFHTMQDILQRGFSLKSIVVKNFEDTAGKRGQQELWRYRALVGGFYVFKHEYIFIFRKQ